MPASTLSDILHAQIRVNGHIIGAAVGSGMTAKYAAAGGADLLLALSAGRFRIMGRGSYASYFCYGNNNEIVMDLGTHELLPVIRDIPVLFGLFASDPEIELYEYLKQIRESGFAGIVNYPTLSLIDGKFRLALEEEGSCFSREVEAVKLAHFLGMFTLAFVTNESETRLMLEAGADIVCVHLGLTKGGVLGAGKYMSIERARKMTKNLFRICEKERPEVIRMIYGGPANTPSDMLYMYKNTGCQGYIGGSTFDRIPVEKSIFETMRSFKNSGSEKIDALMDKAFSGQWNPGDYSEFIKQFVAEHYREEIRLGELAIVLHLSPSYLSTRFKQDTGMNFTEYLVRFRIEKAKELLRTTSDSCRRVAESTGYEDYVQFSKIFKKYTGKSPAEYREETTAV